MINDEIVVLYKRCSKCGEEKTLSEFGKNGKKKDGSSKYRGACKSCCKEYAKEYRETNKDKVKENRKKYYETNKDKLKEYREANKDKIGEYRKEYREANKDKIKEYRKEYYETNKERYLANTHKRRRSLVGVFNNLQLEECLQFFNWECAYSGEIILDDKSNLHREHVIPASKGGYNMIFNIVPSIGIVNISKGDKDVEEWYRQQPYFSEERLAKIYEWMEYAKSKYGQEVA